jgi:hypothetical protein
MKTRRISIFVAIMILITTIASPLLEVQAVLLSQEPPPVEEPIEAPIEEPLEEPIDDPGVEPTEEPGEEPTPIEEPIDIPTDEPVQDPMEPPFGDISDPVSANGITYLEAPYLSDDGNTLYNAVPPRVLIEDDNPEMQNLHSPLDPEMAAAIAEDPSRAANFSITYKAAGTTDPWGTSCTTFPTAAQTAFATAAAIWANTIKSPVPITISACWASSLPAGVLGYSGGQPLHRNYAGLPKWNTWYQGSLANALVGRDLSTSYDMYISYSSTFSWYYGTDGDTPAGQYDLVTVAAHEIAHGLNFSGSAYYSGGTGEYKYSGYPVIYDRFMQSATGKKLSEYKNPSAALGSLFTSDSLFWGGSYAKAANGGKPVKMYAPATWRSGSSFSHLDYNKFAGTINSMMVYAVASGSSQHYPGHVTKGILRDMGWKLASTSTIPTLISPIGMITMRTPTYTWGKVYGATSYRIVVNKGTTKVYEFYPDNAYCGATTCSITPGSVLADGSYTWKVRAYLGGTYRDWSAEKTFKVSTGFTSNFTNNANGWVPQSGTWSITSLGYYRTPGKYLKASTSAYKGTFPTFTYEVRMKRGVDLYAANRVYVRGTPSPLSDSKDWYHGYVFQYANDQSFMVYKRVNGITTILTGWNYSSAINPFGWNTLKVVGSGSSFTYYINGTLVWTGTDASLSTGQVGVGMYRAVPETSNLNVDWAKLSIYTTASVGDQVAEIIQADPYWTDVNVSPIDIH